MLRYLGRKLVQKLCKQYAPNNLLEAMNEHDTATAKDMIMANINKGEDINFAGCEGRNSVSFAIETRNIKIMEFLINNGASVNTIDYTTDSPLMYAIYKGNFETVEFLINKGANINYVNNWGWDPLMSAIKYKLPEIVGILLKNGVDITAADKKEFFDMPKCNLATQKIKDIFANNMVEIQAPMQEFFSEQQLFSEQFILDEIVGILLKNGVGITAADKKEFFYMLKGDLATQKIKDIFANHMVEIQAPMQEVFSVQQLFSEQRILDNGSEPETVIGLMPALPSVIMGEIGGYLIPNMTPDVTPDFEDVA